MKQTGSCKELFGCTGNRTGICSHARALDAERNHYNSLKRPSVRAWFTYAKYVWRLQREVLPHCAQKDQLKAAIERTK
mgnify:CR=1 FL=1|jgi:hypothetical protein